MLDAGRLQHPTFGLARGGDCGQVLPVAAPQHLGTNIVVAGQLTHVDRAISVFPRGFYRVPVQIPTHVSNAGAK